MTATEAFKRYVEVGRVVLLNGGESEGKLAVIAEIIDQNRVSMTGGEEEKDDVGAMLLQNPNERIPQLRME